jgi:hypothetical protein
VRFADGVLTIKGETSEEKEEKKKDYPLGRRFGSFRRSVPGPRWRRDRQDGGKPQEWCADGGFAEIGGGTEKREKDHD